MRLFRFPRACLTAGALLCLAAAAPAADLDKYLPDDAQMVAVVNVKQITAWTPFQKQIQPQLELAMKAGQPADMLKDTGIDPFRDVDRVVFVSAADSYKTVYLPTIAPPPPVKPLPGGPVPPGAPPAPPGLVAPPPPPQEYHASSTSPIGYPTFVLIQGRFDADKLEAKAQQAEKDHPAVIKSRKVGGTELWEILPAGPGPLGGNRLYWAMLDKDTIMATGLESEALEAVDKAAGKTKTDLKDKIVRDAVAKADSKAALQVTVSGDMITQVNTTSDVKGGVTTTPVTIRNYASIEGYHAAVTLGDADMHGELTITFKDADRAKESAKAGNDGLEMGVKNITAAAQQMKDLLPLVDALKTVKITASGDTITAEGNATPDAVVAGVKAVFGLAPAPTKPPEKPIPVDAPPPPKKDK